MTENNQNNTSVILFSTNGLNKVGNAIGITNKILEESISKLFNKAFCLLNSKDIQVCDRDYLSLLQTDPNHRKTTIYHYLANSDNDYQEALNLFLTILEIEPKH